MNFAMSFEVDLREDETAEELAARLRGIWAKMAKGLLRDRGEEMARHALRWGREMREAAERAMPEVAMTGRQLLVALSALPDEELDRVVSLEGCDCHGDLGRVEVGPGNVMLRRLDDSHVSSEWDSLPELLDDDERGG